MDIVIYHNPDCGTSRNTLALLRHFGIEPHVVEYLKTPPSRALLADLAVRTGGSLRDLVREKGTPFSSLGLDDPAIGDDALLDAMIEHPILINRPIVVSPKGVKLCRPSDIVLDLLPETVPSTDFRKEEGVPFLRDERIPGDDPALRAALRAAELADDDLDEPGRTFFLYRTLAGEPVGFGGYEQFGADVLLRSIVVLDAWRGTGIGRNLVPLLQRRAFDVGARRAWLLTPAAAGFFGKLGFKPAERESAPSAILTTRQAAGLCPSDTPLLTRRISF